MKTLYELIKERRIWLAKYFQEWDDNDTEFVAKQYAEQAIDSQKEAIEFAYMMSKAMNDIGSSNVYFIMQQAFEGKDKEFPPGHMSWEDCTKKWEGIISKYEKLKSELK